MEHSIACTLSPAEHRQRTDELTALAARGLRSREQTADGLRLVFSDSAETDEDLRAVIAAEARCCPFLKLDLTRGAHDLVLEITGPENAQDVIAELFG
jgi:hypothetical protein